MNSTCIHLRAGGSNIYMYMKGKYTKNPLKEYNNRKAESEERTKPEEVEEHMATAKAQSFFF
jgi:hypothetical protein